MKKIIRIIVIILLILIILISSIALAGYMYIKSKTDKINTIDIDKAEIVINEEVEENLKSYRNIALFGLDTQYDSFDTGIRSDCIMIISLNEETNEVRLVSVYRDTYTEIEGYGLDKINHAYAFGGPTLALSTLNTTLDLNITEFVTVNFDTVVKIVNQVGGIEMNITSDELKHINNYIKDVSKLSGQKIKNITKTGNQTLNGIQAVAYSRIRYTTGGDYKRTERMRTVLTKVAEKCKKMSIPELTNLLDIMLPEVSTNISSDEILKLLPNALQYNITTSMGWPYEVKAYTVGNWYGVPVTLESNVKKLHEDLFNDKDYEVSSKVKEINQSIINKTNIGKEN